MQATGFGPFRLARPVLYFGLIVGALVAALVNGIVPLSMSTLAERRGEIAENVTARLLREGTFLHPADGMTLFIREISPEGELRDVFLANTRSAGRQTTYSAQRALLVRSAGPELVMFDGMLQTLDAEGRTLAVTPVRGFGLRSGAAARRLLRPASRERALDAGACWPPTRRSSPRSGSRARGFWPRATSASARRRSRSSRRCSASARCSSAASPGSASGGKSSARSSLVIAGQGRRHPRSPSWRSPTPGSGRSSMPAR